MSNVSLADHLAIQDPSGRYINAFVGSGLSGRFFTIIMPMMEVYQHSIVANDRGTVDGEVAQRKLDPKHAQGIGKYIIKGLLSRAKEEERRAGRLEQMPELEKAYDSLLSLEQTQPYLALPPIVANVRTMNADLSEIKYINFSEKYGSTDLLGVYRILFKNSHTLFIVDGQHRRQGLEYAMEFLESIVQSATYPKKQSVYPVDNKSIIDRWTKQVWDRCYELSKQLHFTIEVHIGLGIQEERQLFHDLNRLSKKVSTGLALEFDSSNPVNAFISEVVVDDIFENAGISVTSEDRLGWEDAGYTRKDLSAINAILFKSKTNINGIKKIDVDLNKEIAEHFWRKISEMPGISSRSPKKETLLAQSVMLKSLAKIVYDLHISPRGILSFDQAQKLIDRFSEIDFSHKNPVWEKFVENRFDEIDGLSDYIASGQTELNKDFGNIDENGYIRFGSRHNDIFRPLAHVLMAVLKV